MSKFLTYSVLLYVVSAITSLAQDNYIQFDGIVDDNREPLFDAVVSVYEKGNPNLEDQVSTNLSGAFSVILDYNKVYDIKIQKEGYIYKKVRIDTEMPDDASGKWGIGFAVGLFPSCEGVDLSLMEDPVVIISYNARKKDFQPDNAHASAMAQKVFKLKDDIEKCQNKDYYDQLDKADQHKKDEEYDVAIREYQKALKMKPDEKYPKEMIDECEKLKREELVEEIDESEETIENILDKADKKFDEEAYEEALQLYKKAEKIDPMDPYASSRIRKTEKMIEQRKDDLLAEQEEKERLEKERLEAERRAKLEQEEQERKRLLAEYEAAISRGDNYFKNDNYSEAKNEYQKALQLKPDESYPKERIKEIEALVAEKLANEKEQQELAALKAKKEQEYKKLIGDADAKFNERSLDEAKNLYSRALNMKPGEKYPSDRIKEIDRLIAEKMDREERARELEAQKQALEAKYNKTIAEADDQFDSENYTGAISLYEKAKDLKPGEVYPKQKIAEARDLIAELQKQEQEQLRKKELDEKYRRLIAEADNFFDEENLFNAKLKYQEALAVKPNEAYPEDKIAEIDRVMARKEQEEKEKQRLAEQDKYYKELIEQADNEFTAKNYTKAKSTYQQASGIKPAEVYPKDQMAKIDQILDEERNLANYNNAVTNADRFLREKNYANAKSEYQRALGFLPGKNYPKEKISEIDEIIAKQEQLEKAYKDALAVADDMFKKKMYKDAIDYYNQALSVKPNEQYPEYQISEIEKLINKQQVNQYQEKVVAGLKEYKFKSPEEEKAFLKKLLKEYPPGITKEVYKEDNTVINRYVVIRNNEAWDFREVAESWGGRRYYRNGKPITSMYFQSQVKPKPGEYYKEFN